MSPPKHAAPPVVLDNSSLYAALPPSLGGPSRSTSPSSRLPPLKVADLLPVPGNAVLPPDAVLNARLRNKTLLLDKEAGPASGSSKKPKSRPRWLTESKAAGGSRPTTTHKSTKRARSAKIVIPLAERKYAIYAPLAALWTDYAAKVLGDGNMASAGDRLLRMDLHGAHVEVVRSLDPGLVGICGILIIETAHTVLVIAKNDRLYTVPKNTAVVRLKIADSVFEFTLPLIPYRASERSSRKMKKRHFNFV